METETLQTISSIAFGTGAAEEQGILTRKAECGPKGGGRSPWNGKAQGSLSLFSVRAPVATGDSTGRAEKGTGSFSQRLEKEPVPFSGASPLFRPARRRCRDPFNRPYRAPRIGRQKDGCAVSVRFHGLAPVARVQAPLSGLIDNAARSGGDPPSPRLWRAGPAVAPSTFLRASGPPR